MPTIKSVQFPDGSVRRVEVPDGATNDQIMAFAAQIYQGGADAKVGPLDGSKQQPWQPTRRTPEMLSRNAAEYRDRNPVTNDMGSVQTFAAGVGKSLMDTGQGISQLFGQTSQSEVDGRRAVDDQLMNTKAGIGGNIAGVAGQMFIPGANAAKLVSYAGKGAAALKGAVQGATFAATQPVATGETRLGNAALGGGLGAAGAQIAPMLTNAGVKAANAIKPEVRALYETAKARGITLTPAQLSDSRFMKFMASTLQGLPGSGAKGKAAAQKAAFNRELAGEIGADAPVVTPEVYAGVKAMQGKQFSALTARNDLKVTPDVVQRLESAVKEAEAAGPEVASAVRSAVDRFYSVAQTGERGVFVPGREYQALDSALGQVTKRGDTTAHFVGNVKGAIREAMDASISPKDKAVWDALRRQYGNRKTIRDLVAKGDGGELSPAQLMGRVTATNYGKEAMASGQRGGLGELARIGQALKEPPSSGTAERMLAAQSLNPLAWPIMAARLAGGATVGRAANSQGLSALMMRESRGQPLQGLARLIEKAQPQKLLPAAGVVVSRKKAKGSGP